MCSGIGLRLNKSCINLAWCWCDIGMWCLLESVQYCIAIVW